MARAMASLEAERAREEHYSVLGEATSLTTDGRKVWRVTSA